MSGASTGLLEAPEGAVARRMEALEWAAVARELDAYGCALLPRILTPAECVAIADTYDADRLFRSSVVMARHGFGRGEYRYFAYPLPPVIAELRSALYPPLAAIANRWQEALGRDAGYPATHAEYIDCCHRAGQTRPT